MNKKLERLQQWGCDISAALPRFLEDEAFMLACIEQVAEDASFFELGKNLQQEQINEAFNAAHMLKGILANTGITPLYDTVVTMVEPLRAGKIAGLDQPYAILMNQRQELKRLLEE